jgi:hypothetical protein
VARWRAGGDEHVGGLVLHRLEHGDGAAELLAHLGVLAGHGPRLRRRWLRRREHDEHDRGGAPVSAVGAAAPFRLTGRPGVVSVLVGIVTSFVASR